MIVLATSDKGGTGRSVTSSNILYQLALQGRDVCYVDFDFGSPTAGAIFESDKLARGTTSGLGLHAYFQRGLPQAEYHNLWKTSDRDVLRHRPAGAGRLVLAPGDQGGAEFTVDRPMVEQCRKLFFRLEEEFELSVIDLSAGRSYALQMALAVTAGLDPDATVVRWLVFHRWTQQHVTAAHGLVYGDRGILDSGVRLKHDRDALLNQIRFVRTAVIDPNAPDLAGLRPAQLSWLNKRHRELQDLASKLNLGVSVRLGSVPLDPVLQWHEQLLTEQDEYDQLVANPATVEALEQLARRIADPAPWEPV